MGATGVSLTAGMTNTTFLEAEIKRAVVHRADNIYGMVDSSKIGKEAIVTFCHLGATLSSPIDLTVRRKRKTHHTICIFPNEICRRSMLI